MVGDLHGEFRACGCLRQWALLQGETRMKQGRFANEQIGWILRETDQDSVVGLAKRHGDSQATIYAWRKRFGQPDTDEVKRPTGLEQENARLHKLLIGRDLQIDLMREINEKKW